MEEHFHCVDCGEVLTDEEVDLSDMGDERLCIGCMMLREMNEGEEE